MYPINTDIISNQKNRSNVKRAETRFFVVHETVSKADARRQLAYFNRFDVSANAHAFIDWNEVLLTLPVDEVAWSVGLPANNFTFNVELCHASNTEEFAKEWAIATWYAAKWCIDGNRDPMTFIKSHDEIRREFGDTDHTDPNAYFSEYGKTMDDFRRDVAAIVNAARNPQKTSIFGQATATVEQMREYLKRKNPNAPDYAQLYLNIGARYGIRGDLAFCQSIKETGAWKFGGQVKPDQNNFAGLGATNGGAAGATFQTPSEGIEAQMQHLWGYATTNDLPIVVTLIDPRFDLLSQTDPPRRGSAPNWEDLSNKWAVPKEGQPPNTYGEDIVAMWKEMCSIEVPKQDDVTEKAIELIKQILDEIKRRGSL
jgi:hypothetical protein